MKRENLKRLVIEATTTLTEQEVTAIRICGAIVYLKTSNKRITLLLQRCNDEQIKAPYFLVSKDLIDQAVAIRAEYICQFCETCEQLRILPMPEDAPDCIRLTDEFEDVFYLYTNNFKSEFQSL